MSDKNIEIIKHIQATGRCPEDDRMATNSFTKSGFQPKAGNKFTLKKSIDTNPPKISKKNEEVEIDYSNSLFDPNEKDPAMRALNMVKEYCRVSLKELYEKDLGIKEIVNQQKAYTDVINFIEDHQIKCKATQNQNSTPTPEKDFTLKHLQNERRWFEKRMRDYKESFFKVCDIVEHSDCAGIIKKLINEERERY